MIQSIVNVIGYAVLISSGLAALISFLYYLMYATRDKLFPIQMLVEYARDRRKYKDKLYKVEQREKELKELHDAPAWWLQELAQNAYRDMVNQMAERQIGDEVVKGTVIYHIQKYIRLAALHMRDRSNLS